VRSCSSAPIFVLLLAAMGQSATCCLARGDDNGFPSDVPRQGRSSQITRRLPAAAVSSSVSPSGTPPCLGRGAPAPSREGRSWCTASCVIFATWIVSTKVVARASTFGYSFDFLQNVLPLSVLWLCLLSFGSAVFQLFSTKRVRRSDAELAEEAKKSIPWLLGSLDMKKACADDAAARMENGSHRDHHKGAVHELPRLREHGRPRSLSDERVAISRRESMIEKAGYAQSPTLNALTDKQRELLTEMRRRLDAFPKGVLPERRHDLWLKRFLAHAKWKVDKAVEVFVEMEKWRKENRADCVLEDFPDGVGIRALPCDLLLFLPYGTDRLGRPVTLMTPGVGGIWYRSLFEPISALCNSQIWLSEWNQALVETRAAETGEWRERAVVLIDLGHMNWAFFQAMLKCGRARRRAKLARSSIKNYPGFIDQAFIINAPSFIHQIWGILKLFLSEALMSKAKFVSTPEERSAMLQELGIENVPRRFGGLSDATEDPLMPEHLKMPAGGWSAVVERWRPQELPIEAGGCYEKVLMLPEGGRVTWQWALVEYSITFQVSRRRANERQFDVISVEEPEFSDKQDPLIGEVSAPEGGGEVRLFWNNEFSRFRGKLLLLRLEVC